MSSFGELASRLKRPVGLFHSNDGPRTFFAAKTLVFSAFLTLDELARDLDVGVSLVQKTFQKELGISPMALIADMRLEHAASFLERGDWTPSELAHICGYSELSAFSRAFKRKFGVSPKAFAAKR